MPWCTQTMMCQCTLIFDVHYHIIPYVHFHNLASPGSPSRGVTQPSGGFSSGHPRTALPLQSQKGSFCAPPTKRREPAMIFTTPCITARAQTRLPKPFLQMQIKVCAQKAATFSYLGLANAVTAGGRGVNTKTLGSFAPLLNWACKMVALCRAVTCICWFVHGKFLQMERDAVDVSHDAQPCTCSLVTGTDRH